MSADNRKPVTKQQLVVEVWEQTGKESAGAVELDLIQQGLVAHFGAVAYESPASIARTLADHGVLLRHPEVLEADLRWRERHELFTPADLNFGALEAAITLIGKIEGLRRQFDGQSSMFEHLRQRVRHIKTELELLAAKQKTGEKELAQEVVQWLTVWLENPQIFQEWLDLRRSTAEFKDRFNQ
jgi:hypothetical protein